MNIIKLQLGKQGLTKAFIETVRKSFANVENVRISLLPSSGRDKEKTKKWADKLVSELGDRYTARVIGFTIILKKWRKSRTSK